MDTKLMPIKEDQKEDIRRKIVECGCDKKIKCIDTNFEDVAPVKNAAASDLLECYTDRAKNCNFALPFGSTYFCRCPVRAYLYQNFGI
jgi:hypothetical protein